VNVIYQFFQTHIILVYFIYGLVFFMMGFAISLQNDKPSSLILGRSFKYLAAFGFVHGLSEWGYVFIPIMENYSSPRTIASLYFIEISLIGFSFLFLFYFGLKLCTDTLDLPEPLLWLPRLAGPLWFIAFILSPHLLRADNIPHWYLLGDITSRYFFAFPGSLLSAYAIWKQQDELSVLEQPRVIRDLRRAAYMFVLYAFFAGAIVPQAPFIPADRLNIQNLFRYTGIPVAVYRAAICTVIAYHVIRLTAVFSYEYQLELADAREDYAVLKERQRIRRALHDGILQQIYAIGLSLQSAEHALDEEPARAREILARESKHLDRVNREIRRYIMDVGQTSFREKTLHDIVLGMADDFNNRSPVPLQVSINTQAPEHLDDTQKENIYLIIQELLSNIARHSRATSASLALNFTPEGLTLVISDNGQGFTVKKKRSGLQNILERAQIIPADIDIDSRRNRGTTVTLTLNYPAGADRAERQGAEPS
jgi:signal transduction histidine kinase